MENEPDGDTKVNKAEKTRSSGDLSSAEKPPEEERIRALAYSIWVEEGRPDGCDVDHWLRAQGELERKAA